MIYTGKKLYDPLSKTYSTGYWIKDTQGNWYPVWNKQEPKTGRWIAVENEEMETVGYYCSKCDLPMETEQRTNFCPNCGAKMVKSQAESEEKE